MRPVRLATRFDLPNRRKPQELGKLLTNRFVSTHRNDIDDLLDGGTMPVIPPIAWVRPPRERDMNALKRDDIIVHELDDELLLYDPEQDRSHRLNVTAALVWRLCDGRHSIEDIARLLTEHYEVDYPAACRDAESAVRRMVDESIVSSV